MKTHKSKKLVFLISPVRNTEPETLQHVVDWLEREHIVYWPMRDTEQTATSLQICEQNRAAIKSADLVYVFWDPNSEGTVFDLGMAFAMQKEVRVINPNDVEVTEGKSFENFLLAYELSRGA